MMPFFWNARSICANILVFPVPVGSLKVHHFSHLRKLWPSATNAHFCSVRDSGCSASASTLAMRSASTRRVSTFLRVIFVVFHAQVDVFSGGTIGEIAAQ